MGGSRQADNVDDTAEVEHAGTLSSPTSMSNVMRCIYRVQGTGKSLAGVTSERQEQVR